MDTLTAPLVFSAVLLSLVLYLFQNSYRYPPGPKGHFLVGNIFQVPRTLMWQYFLEISKTYGPIVRVSLAGNDIIALSTSKDADELLNKRSANYSSRSQPIYAGKYLSGGKRLVLTPYGDEMKKLRTAFHSMLQPRVVGSYESMQELESIRLLSDMLRRPKEADLNTKRYAASLVFSLSYGRRMPNDDKDLKDVSEILDNFIQDAYPGSHLVDSIPILDKLPDFLSPWRKEAKAKHQYEIEVFSRLVLQAKTNMEKKGHLQFDCFASRLWEEKEKLELDLVTMSYVCGVAFDAGTDSTSATMQWFMMAMALNPDALKKAQQEIDSVVGADGVIMPNFTNFKELPYCGALCKEVFRWRPAAPGAFPHLSLAEDEYKGYRIKAKTMVIPNTFAIHHNEEEFPEHERFMPERYLREDMEVTTAWLTEGHYVFGFGRRACPGKYLASRSVWIGIVRLMWAFDIAPARDDSGNPVELNPNEFTPGITTKPESLLIEVTPRTPKHAAKIEEMWMKISQ
ncbi:cytochrome P450 [Fomitiporia mediterranea MF3/22]|uniref:cytochrome P450 n=1 Tax=Fomitiporia mediterranea (strain MF3/22) TaxID=694068 RepID=UPI0004408F3D|nr:cytochrome P450 [Fomitiporia mediterranea MF3/22]EJC99744.1 cytochrome P450 [Fomitiporia mediterranea MF3/22]